MMFCGIEKNSLNDFPGKVSCIIFVSGCNFVCPYCHNPQTLIKNPKNSINKKKILNYIKQQKKFCDGIVISGGEPTINTELPTICKNIKNMGYQIKVDTNGSRPNMLNKLISENLIDYVAMDIKTYPSEIHYKKLTNEANISKTIKKSIELIMLNAPDYEFRTTCIKPFVNHEMIEQISYLIKDAKKYTLQPFNKYAPILNKSFFKNINPSIPRKEIQDFLEIARPLVKQCKTTSILED